MLQLCAPPDSVIPAKAGIHFAFGGASKVKMDSGLRRNDGRVAFAGTATAHCRAHDAMSRRRDRRFRTHRRVRRGSSRRASSGIMPPPFTEASK